MSEYHKIHSIYMRDETTHRLLPQQWAQPEFEYLADCDWEWTEKVNGTNIRVMVDSTGIISFGGKTFDSQIPAQLVTRLRERLSGPGFAGLFPSGACLYGEGYGAKIQKGGGNYRADQDFVLFDVRVGGWWLRRPDVEDVANLLNLDVVPIVGRGSLYDAVDFVATGFNSRWGNFLAEGVVARPAVELQTRGGDRIITKIKYKDFNL